MIFADSILKTLKGQKRKRDTELTAPPALLNGSISSIGNGDPVTTMGGSLTPTTSTTSEVSVTEDEERKKKKVRTTFTGRQIFELEKMFESKKYLSSSERADMAKLLNVTEQQVSVNVNPLGAIDQFDQSHRLVS